MRVSLVVAASENHVIGREGRLPWRIPEDLQRFRQLTMGKPLLMGRRTFDSIGRPLPGRRNIVISRQPGLKIAGCEVAGSPESARDLVRDVDEAMVIGGSAIYHYFLPLAERIYLTRIHATLDGDAFFPELDEDAWRTVATERRQSADAGLAFTFETLERRPARAAACG